MYRKALMFLMTLTLLCVSCGSVLAEDVWICGNCQYENPANSNFCGNCRSPRPTNEIVIEGSDNAWVCSSCGEVCPDGTSFCRSCAADHNETDERALYIAETRVTTADFSPAEVIAMDMEFTQKNEEQDYEFIPPVTGIYRIFLKTAYSGFYANVRVNDPLKKEIGFGNLSQGKGMDVSMEAGERYIIRFIQHVDLGPFTMCMGIPREITGLEGARRINDSMSFTHQENRYILIPETSGKHRFWFTGTISGFYPTVTVTDPLQHEIVSLFVFEGKGITAELKAGETYLVTVRQEKKLGDYQMHIGCPKPVTDISGSRIIGDDLSYTEQENVYTWTAAKDGKYEFKLTKTPKNFTVTVTVLDPTGHDLLSLFFHEGDKHTVSLKAGTTYTVMVSYYKGHGSYVLQINERP